MGSKLMAIKELIVLLNANKGLKTRFTKYYHKYGANATKKFITQLTGIAIHVTAKELRELLDIPSDAKNCHLAVEAHRLAWDAAGWRAGAWTSSPGGDDGCCRRGRGGGKRSLAAARAAQGVRGQ